MRDTRQAILDTAKTLFLQKGYNGVSVGDIAGALGISKGNLTYHFKRKEEIMEALLAQTTPAFPQTIPRTLEELDALLRHIEQVQEDYAFYFRDHAQLGQLSQEIRAKQQGVYRRQSAFFCQTFRSLAQEGLVQPEAYPGAYRRSADTLHLAAVYWLPFATLKERDEGFRCQAWAILFPLLTPEGQTACRERAALF